MFVSDIAREDQCTLHHVNPVLGMSSRIPVGELAANAAPF
jgi:hypothetical protein